MEPEEFEEWVMRACTRQAKRVHRVNRGYVEYADVLGEMYVWVAKNTRYITEWHELGQHGKNKLNVALYRAGHAFASRERARRTGSRMGDFFWYTPAVVEDLLPDVWDYSTWDQGQRGEPDMPRGKSRPDEGGNRRAMMCDLAYAVAGLPADDQRLLRDRYFLYPSMPTEQLASRWELTADGFRKKHDRIIVKLIDRLGGEPPFWPNSRRAQSNAAAQSRTGRQDG